MRAAHPYSSSLSRRLTAVVAAALLPLVGLAAPAFAGAGDVTVVSTNGNVGASAASNTATATVLLQTVHDFVYPIGGGVTITFTRTGTAGQAGLTADEIGFTIGSTSGNPTAPGTANRFTGTVDLTLANPGDYDITVSGISGGAPVTDSCAACFSVLSSAPTVSSIDVPTIAAGGSAKVTVTGTKFARGNYAGADSNYACSSCASPPVLAIQKAGAPVAGITFSDPTTNAGGPVEATSTTITKVVNVGASTTPGTYDVYVENTDGKSGLLAGSFTVAPAPVISTVSPATRGANSTGGEIVITGSNFPSDLTGTIAAAQGQTNGVTYTYVRDSATKLRFTNLAVASNATLGQRTITLTSASKHVTLTDTSFSVTPAPSLTSITADNSLVSRTYGQGADNVSLTLHGSNFVDGATPVFSPSTGITVVSATVNDSMSITAVVSISAAASAGNVPVSVVNGDGGVPTSTCSGSSCTLVVRGAPTITSVTPSHGSRGATVSVTIKGTNLADSTNKTPPTITFTGGTVSNVTVVSSSQLTADVNLGASTIGTLNFDVVNNDDRGHAVCAGCFTSDTLAVTDATVKSGFNDSSISSTVTGSGFTANATVQLVKIGDGSAIVPPIHGVVTVPPTESSAGAADGTSLTATFNLNGVDPGTYEYRVTNPTGDKAGSGQGVVFTVVGDSPVISSVSPDTRGGGAVGQTVVISGTAFGPHASVTFSSAAVHVDSTTVNSSTKITVRIHVDQIASNENGTVTVTNTDNGSGQAAFHLVVGPTFNGGTAVTAGQGSSGVAFSMPGVRGTFPATADAQLTATGGTGVTFSNVTVTPGTAATAVPPAPATDDKVDATMQIAQDATLGAFDVVLVDASTGGRGLCTGCVVVTAAPVIDSVAPGSGRPGQDVQVTVSGSGFQAGATLAVTNGITVSNVTVAATSITATFSIPAGASAGTFADVTVTNPGAGGARTAPGAFEITAIPDVITIDKSAGQIVYGRTVMLSGALTEKDSGVGLGSKNVVVYGKTQPGTTYQVVGSTTTDPAGNWSLTVAPHRTTSYYVSYAGAGAHGPAVSTPVEVQVAFKITWVKPKPGGSLTHGRVAIRVKVRDLIVGASGVLLKRTADGSVARLSGAKLGARGFMTFHTRLKAGTYRIAVRVPSQGGCVGHTTRFIKIHVV